MNPILKKIIDDRWSEIPDNVKTIFKGDTLLLTVNDLSNYYQLGAQGSEGLKEEILLTLFGFESLNNLKERLSKKLGVSVEIAEAITSELELGLFFNAIDFLKELARQSDFHSISSDISSVIEGSLETKERLELRPHQSSAVGISPTTPGVVTPTPAKPLTRDELMSALAGKRTMAQDIEALRKKQEGEK